MAKTFSESVADNGASETRAAPSDAGHRVTFIILRYMRRPILVLVTVYAVSMVGWVIIPGADVDGDPSPMSFFHAFYFLTYTATTTGFGEIPFAFSDAQRMWSIVSLYSGVVAWLYAVGSIVQLLQNPHFRLALAERRFAKLVSRIREPFVIVCGFGSTGSLLARGLSDAGVIAVVLDHDKDRINALQLRDYRVMMPGLCANARVPARLIDAGLTRPNCKAVLALTGDEEVNLKIAVATRLLNPAAQVIAQSTSEAHEEAIATLGSEVHIVDPFQTYARYLGATIHSPGIYVLNRWLVGEPGAALDDSLSFPRGRWILCGFGRMGRRIDESLRALDIETTVIDPDFVAADAGDTDGDAAAGHGDAIAARASQAALREAGIARASGVVAGTDDDAYNLSILLNARALNPDIFVIVRQDLHMNQVLYSIAGAELIMQPSLVSARRILFELIAPLLKPFFEHLREAQLDGDKALLQRVFRELREHIGGGCKPRLSTVDLTETSTPAVISVLAEGTTVTLADLLRDPRERQRRLRCVPLVVKSRGALLVMPELDLALRPGDQILLCCRPQALHLVDATLHNEYTLRYLITGVDAPRSYLLRWWARRRYGARQVLPEFQQ